MLANERERYVHVYICVYIYMYKYIYMTIDIRYILSYTAFSINIHIYIYILKYTHTKGVFSKTWPDNVRCSFLWLSILSEEPVQSHQDQEEPRKIIRSGRAELPLMILRARSHPLWSCYIYIYICVYILRATPYDLAGAEPHFLILRPMLLSANSTRFVCI